MENESEQTIIFPDKLKYIALVISFICFWFIVFHILFPDLSIDTITIILILIMIFPWLYPYVKSISLPGGWGVEFRDAVKHLEETADESNIMKDRDRKKIREEIEPIKLDLLRIDPIIAFASLRSDLERKISEILNLKNIELPTYSIHLLLSSLFFRDIISSSDYQTINEIIKICNQVIHGRKIDISVAIRVYYIGQATLTFLDSLIDLIKQIPDYKRE